MKKQRRGIHIKPKGRFSAGLKAAIERRHISLTELAETVDSTYEHMRKLVGGRAYPSRNLLPRLATALGADLEQWEEFVEWDQLHKRYGGIPKCVQLSDKMRKFQRVISKLGPEQYVILLAFARSLREQYSKSN